MTTTTTPAVLADMLDAFYLGHWSPVRDYLLDLLKEGSPDYLLAESGVWRGTLADWLRDGPGLVRRLPVVRVELTNREPCHRMSKFYWYVARSAKRLVEVDYCDNEDLLSEWFPEENSDSSRVSAWIPYDTRELALDDASRRAIAWARNAKETT